MNRQIAKTTCLLILQAATCLLLGCATSQPAPEAVVEPPPAVELKTTDLGWLMVLPQHSLFPRPPLLRVQKPANPLVHTVRAQGETLIAIARWYTGDANNWHQLMHVNNNPDPQHMKIGTAIMIPEQMLITHQTMPKIITPIQRIGQEPRSSAELKKSVTEPQLFGPIEITLSPELENISALPRPLQRLDESP